MTLKKWLAIPLIVFVIISLGVLARDLVGNLVSSEVQPQVGSKAPPGSCPQVIVYFFHGNTRCRACQAIETQARKTLETRFADRLARGEIEWKVLNFEAPENASLARKFELFSTMVILADGKTSPASRWKSLDDVWNQYDHPEAFQNYVQKSLENFLKENRRDPGLSPAVNGPVTPPKSPPSRAQCWPSTQGCIPQKSQAIPPGASCFTGLLALANS